MTNEELEVWTRELTWLKDKCQENEDGHTTLAIGQFLAILRNYIREARRCNDFSLENMSIEDIYRLSTGCRHEPELKAMFIGSLVEKSRRVD